MSLAVVSPVLNEIDYIKAWCECVTKFADWVVVADMGSTDGTLDILRDYRIPVISHPSGGPYKGSEAEVRNRLDAYANCDWIFRLDADELVHTRDIPVLKEALAKTKKHFVWLPFYSFWLDKRFIRANQWDRGIRQAFRNHPCSQPLIHRNGVGIHWQDISREYWRPKMVYKSYGKLSARLFGLWLKAPVMYHFHYAHPKSYPGQRDIELKESWIKCVTYFGEHPEEVKHYAWWNHSGHLTGANTHTNYITQDISEYYRRPPREVVYQEIRPWPDPQCGLQDGQTQGDGLD